VSGPTGKFPDANFRSTVRIIFRDE